MDAPERLEEYARDCWPMTLWRPPPPPADVAHPRTTEELAQILRRCAEKNIPVVPRGGGSGVLGAAIPSKQGAIVLDLRGLDGEPVRIGNGIVRAGAGIFGDVLEDRLNKDGLSCAHFPASMAVSTLGGWVATDSWGQSSTAHGPFRDRLHSLVCVLPDGQVLQDVDPKEWVGSEGSLGVIASVAFRPIPLETEYAFASWEFPDMPSGLRALRKMTEAGIRPTVVRLYDGLDRIFLGPEKKSVSEKGSLGDEVKARLLRLRGGLRTLCELPGIRGYLNPLLVVVGTPPEVREAAQPLARSLGEGPARNWWQRRYRLNFAKVENYRRLGCFADTLDIFAPWSRIEEVYAEMVRAARPHGLTMAHASHLCEAGACLYFTLSGAGGSVPETLRFYEDCWKEMIEACIRAGGRPDHHHGIGLAKRPWLNAIRPAGWVSAMRRRKNRFDPKGLMNPGKWL